MSERSRKLYRIRTITFYTSHRLSSFRDTAETKQNPTEITIGSGHPAKVHTAKPNLPLLRGYTTASPGTFITPGEYQRAMRGERAGPYLKGRGERRWNNGYTISFPFLQIECLFLALTSVGKDLELEIRESLEKLFYVIKQVFLMNADSPQIKKTLLQLIELRAANWQLPVSAISYYYPKYSN